MMAKIVVTWTMKTEKQIQHDIGGILKCLESMEFEEIKKLIKELITICHNDKLTVTLKLRFGQILFYAADKYEYPFSIRNNIDNFDILLLLIYFNGLLDTSKSVDRFLVSTKILFEILNRKDSSYQYHICFLIKKWWNEFNREITDNNLEFKKIDQIIRYFLPCMNSAVSGLPSLVDGFYSSLIKWSLDNKKIGISTEIIKLFDEIIFHEFYSTDLKEKEYPLIKINLKYLKIIISSFNIQFVLAKLPFLIEYLFQVVTFCHTAPVVKDIFISISKQHELPDVFIIKLQSVLRQFIFDNFEDKLWYDEASFDLQKFKFTEYILPYLIKIIPDYLEDLFEELTVKINKENLNDYHYLYLWISIMTALDISKVEYNIMKKCLWNNNDQIRMIAYKFVCDHYSEFSSNHTFAFCDILNLISHNLTNDKPGFRNNFLNQTKRLLTQIRDSVVLEVINTKQDLDNFLEILLDVSNVVVDGNCMHLEMIDWTLIQQKLTEQGVVRLDLGILLIFTRILTTRQWIYSCSNYQRQKTMAELISIIYDVLLAEGDIYMDKMCGFNKKTKIQFKQVLSELVHTFIFPNQESMVSICRGFLKSIQHARSDVQTKLYDVIRRLLKLESINIKFQGHTSSSNVIADSFLPCHDEMMQMCHSTQPNISNVGAHLLLLDVQLNKQDFYWLNAVSDYLTVTNNLADNEIAKYAMSKPGHGLLIGIEKWLLDTGISVSIDIEPQIKCLVRSCIQCIDNMLGTMGSHSGHVGDCNEEDELVSFQQMGVSIQSLATVTDDNRDCVVKMTGVYQHLLSWSWQTLKNCVGLCVAGYFRLITMDAGNIESKNNIGELVAHSIIRVITKSRHRGTIESVSKYLKIHLSNLASSNCGINSRHVAMETCLGNAIFGKYSVTRRSAGLPLMLIAALASTKTEVDAVLVSDVVNRLVTIAADLPDNKNGSDNSSVLTDSPNIHALNLLKRVVMEPSLATCPSVTKRLGDLIVLTLSSGFTTQATWGVRNAALQLFVTTASRLACVNQGIRTNASVLEVFGMYPKLVPTLTDILQNPQTACCVMVPTLTFFSQLLYSSPSLLPAQYSLSLLPALRMLMRSEFCTIRRLSVKCILNLCPDSIGEYKLPDVNDCYNLQHSKLLLLQQDVSSLSQPELLSYLTYLHSKQLWYLLQHTIPLLKYIDIDSKTFMSLSSSLTNDKLNCKTGYIDYCVALLDLLAHKNVQVPSDIIKNLLFNPSMHPILQEMVQNNEHIIHLLFSDYFSLTIQATVQFSSSYSFRYLIHILAHLVKQDNTNHCITNLSELYQQLQRKLNSSHSDSVISNAMVVMTWVCIHTNSLSFDALMSHILAGLEPDKPDTIRNTSLWTLSRIMTSSRQYEIRQKSSCDIVTAIILGCFDEDSDVRCGFRKYLYGELKEETLSIISAHEFRRFVTSQDECLAVWRRGCLRNIRMQINDVLKGVALGDILYEPALSNIFLEIGFLLDILVDNLRFIGNLENEEFQNKLVDLIMQNEQLLQQPGISKLSSFEPSIILAKTSLSRLKLLKLDE